MFAGRANEYTMSVLKEQSNDADPFMTLLPDLSAQEFCADSAKVFSYTRGFGSVDKDKPVLVLLHGYPQSYVD